MDNSSSCSCTAAPVHKRARYLHEWEAFLNNSREKDEILGLSDLFGSRRRDDRQRKSTTGDICVSTTKLRDEDEEEGNMQFGPVNDESFFTLRLEHREQQDSGGDGGATTTMMMAQQLEQQGEQERLLLFRSHRPGAVGKIVYSSSSAAAPNNDDNSSRASCCCKRRDTNGCSENDPSNMVQAKIHVLEVKERKL